VTGDDALNSAERGLVQCYENLVEIMRERSHELAPFEERNATKAIAALWQVVNGLDRDPGQLYDIGI
jgi:hypothetical protein